MWHEDDRMVDVYTSLDSGGPFPRACPACGERHAHVLMHRFGSSDPRGTVWAWCRSCGGHAHFGAAIPVWWRNPEFVDEARLDSYVDYPDSISGLIDEWMNALLNKVRYGTEASI
jgi:hypothetical protein